MVFFPFFNVLFLSKFIIITSCVQYTIICDVVRILKLVISYLIVHLLSKYSEQCNRLTSLDIGRTARNLDLSASPPHLEATLTLAFVSEVQLPESVTAIPVPSVTTGNQIALTTPGTPRDWWSGCGARCLERSGGSIHAYCRPRKSATSGSITRKDLLRGCASVG